MDGSDVGEEEEENDADRMNELVNEWTDVTNVAAVVKTAYADAAMYVED